MPIYNISVVVDPSSATSGVNVVEGGLQKLETKATAVQGAIQRAFDFNTTAATRGASSVDAAMDGVKSSTDRARDSVRNLHREFNILQAPSMKAADNMRAISTNLQRLYPELERTAGATARVQNSQAQVRASTLQLGQQFNDFSTQVMSGQSALLAFAQQSGQAAFALQGMNGKLGQVGTFLAGPWGTILTIATVVMAGFVTKLLAGNEGLDDRVEKLRKDAQETALDEQAQRSFSMTLDGVTDALRRNKEALEELEDGHKTAARRALEDALASQERLRLIRAETSALIDQAEAMLEIQRARASGPGQQAELAALNLGDRMAAIERLRGNLTRIDAQIVEAERQMREAQSRRIVEIADQTPEERIRSRYDRLIEQARERAIAEGTVSTQLARQVQLLGQQREAELRALQESNRRGRGDGVSRFTSRQQAIGIAGRELQRAGLSVGQNEQFGGVTGNHPGMGNRAHGQFAIDVDIRGATDRAPTPPDIRQQYAETARRYAARGYRVLWAGTVYEPDGSTHPIRNGNQHYGHMHIEAPQSIVGRATQASGESQEIARERAAAQQAEAQRDFVQGVVDAAGARGQVGRVATVEAQLERVFSDFQRRFNREMTPDEQGRVRTALTEAEAREIARHFEQAYVEPLERLEALQGRTGIDREILNTQLEETARLGRALTPVEEAQIDRSIRQGQALTDQARILEEIKGPQEQYAARVAALNALLERGVISQTTYNARIGDLGRTARDMLSDMPGVDPNTGMSYSEIAAGAEENARFASELEALAQQREELLRLGIDYDALEEAAAQRHADNLMEIERQRYAMMIQGAQSVADGLMEIAESTVGKQSAVYKALFVASKAFAIAEAILNIQRGVSQALALPFPANIPAIASVVAAAASIIQNIQSVRLNLADGGYVVGPGGPRSDRVPANLSNGEYVVNAAATAANRPWLDAINSGRAFRDPKRSSNDNATMGGRPVLVNIDATAAPGVEFEEAGVTEDRVDIIARRAVAREAPRAVAAAMHDPNSRVSRSMGSVLAAKRKRA